ncbi:MAG: hypothetical protein GY757_08480 [bacterium]|nr:hypothetical protein [bacterium]
MKKLLILFLFLCLAFSHLYSIIPFYHGARSLSLGYSGSSFNYDINSIFINPSLLSTLTYSLSGYQYQNSYLDYNGFNDDLTEILATDLANYETLESAAKQTLFSKLEGLLSSRRGMYGFNANVPGFVAKNYGISYSTVDTAVISPLNPADTTIFDKEPGDVTNDEINTLQMNLLGLSYKKISIAYSMGLSRSLNAGVSVHYLKGKVTEFNASLTDDFFNNGQSKTRDYLKDTWDQAEEKFSRVVVDLSLSMDVGRHFRVSVIAKNVGDPKITTPLREITMKQRLVAGLSFRPKVDWGIYMDVDIAESDLLYNGEKMQPISFGIEKGFFKNRIFVRAGFLNDLTEKHFFGSKANVLYGLGLGFNMQKFIVDCGIGLDNNGSIKSLSVSGFILLK